MGFEEGIVMPELHFSTDIQRPPDVVFNLIADLANYHQWLPPSKIYAATLDITESPVILGTTYRDNNTMYGKVIAYQPPTLITFRQSTKNPGLDITIRYELSAGNTSDATHLVRTVTVSTARIFRLFQSIAVRGIRQENERILLAMKRYLETKFVV